MALALNGCGGAVDVNVNVDDEVVVDSKGSLYSAETPEQALALFYDGIFEGNLAKAQSRIIDCDGMVLYLEANIAVNKAMNDFARVDNKHFGEGPKAFPVDGFAIKTRGDLQRVKVALVDETHANWPLNPKSPMQLVKTKDGWKVDMSRPQFKEFLSMSAETFQETAKIYSGLTARIRKDEFESRDAVRQAMKERLQ